MSMKPFTQWLDEDYGKVLFAPDRTDVPSPPEPNTPPEDGAWEAFRSHYLGGRDGNLLANLPALLAAKQQKKYRDFLDVPSRYKFAYRLMADIPMEYMKSNFKFAPKTIAEHKRGILSGGVYDAALRRISSWTVDVSVLPKLVKDFGSLYRKHAHSYHILLIAKIANNPDAFLINPDMYRIAPDMAAQFSYQKEIISYAPVRVSKTVYCDKDEFNGNDTTIIEWLIKQSRSLNL